MSVVTYTDLPFKVFKKGKVRDVYEVDNNLLLIVTDRISAFDYVLEDPIPYKGVCLTQISKFWFDFFKDTVPSHVVSADVADFPSELRKHEDVLSGRSMLVKKAEVFPIECIVRGYISGSATVKLTICSYMPGCMTSKPISTGVSIDIVTLKMCWPWVIFSRYKTI